MESHGGLDQSLEKLLVLLWCGAPNVLQEFVRVEEFRPVKRGNSLLIFFVMHNSFWHRRKQT